MAKATPDIINFSDLEALIRYRLKQYFNSDKSNSLPFCKFPPGFSPLAKFARDNELTHDEMGLLLLALVPHVDAYLLDKVIQENIQKAGDFPHIGGVRGKQFRGLLPTGETALFIFAGKDQEKRLTIRELLSPDHFFSRRRIFWLQPPPDDEPMMSGRIAMSQEYIDLFTLGKITRPRFSITFPAQRIETQLEWNDLVLNEQTAQQISELETWIKYGKVLNEDWEMSKKLKPGYRVLFHGPPGTGKTLTASLLGKYTNRDVYRVDLSMVVSKYIGETEKNLHNLFAKAESKDWILFFDEADALFGKRTNVKDAHDKYANQEVSYLLQRVEDYNGLTILASNLRSNIDDAFTRRFQSIIHFPMPRTDERLKIWQQAFPAKATLDNDLDLKQIAQKYELSGADIMNIVQYCCLCALERGDHLITQEDIMNGIKKEFLKEGKIMH